MPMPPSPTAGRFVRTFVAAALAGCLAVAGLNVLVNPLGYYPVRLVRPLAWGDRQIKTDLMRQSPAPAVLVLGSSRTMKLAPADIQQLTGQTAFNAGVSSGLPEDMDALFRYATADLHWHPKELILGIDLQALDPHKQLDHALLTTPALQPYLPRTLRWQGWRESLTAMLAAQQTQLSLKALRCAVVGSPPDPIAFDPDGLLHYRSFDQQIAAGTFRPDVQTYLPFYRRLNAEFQALDPQRLQTLDELVRTAAAAGIRVRAFITPYHPAVLTAMQDVPTFQGVLAALRTHLNRLQAATPGFSWQDFSDIAAFQGDSALFYDGIGHLQPENARRLLTELLRDR